MNNITGVIITLNEEKNIEEAIVSLRQICDEIVVLDSGSLDNTCAIAKSLGAIVHVQRYLGDGFQKKCATEFASHDWVFSLDADERLTPELVAIIHALDLANSPKNGYAVKRKSYIGSRWIKCCGWYPDYLVRLFHKGRTNFVESKQHAHVPSDNTLKLNADIEHYSYQNIGELFAKPGRNFSGRGAKIMFENGKKVSAFAPFSHALWAFIRCYFFQKGIFYGLDGFTLSVASSCNAYLKYAKLIEYQRDSKVREAEDFGEVW